VPVLCLLVFLKIPSLHAAEVEQITLTVGKSFVIETPGDMERVLVATDDVIEAVAVSQRQVVLNGKAPGETSVLIWQRNGGARLAYNVVVEASRTRNDALTRRLKAELGDSIQGELDDKTVILRGKARTQEEGDRAMAIATAFGTPVNLMTIAVPAAQPQILLRVRFASVDRTASLSLGANIFSTGAGNNVGSVSTGQFSGPSASGSISKSGSETFTLSNALNVFLFRPDLNLGATIEALAAKGLVQILAEPNVLATAGKQASFLAGGEFPFPVVQSSSGTVPSISIQFREFGIRLNFTPYITPRGTIRLEVAPEVSSLDYANGLTLQGLTVPGLDVRKVSTEIELQNLQSFAIAGLIDNRVTENLSKIPGLGDIPLLGKLFQSQNISRTNSEILIVVTPELVQPISGAPPALAMPLPFLKDGATALPATNTPDTRPLPKSDTMPFEPTDRKPTTQAPSVAAPVSLGVKESKGGMKP
jgi:pilus assembly protein CpaC